MKLTLPTLLLFAVAALSGCHSDTPPEDKDFVNQLSAAEAKSKGSGQTKGHRMRLGDPAAGKPAASPGTPAASPGG